MIPTFSARNCFRARAIAGSIVLLACGGSSALAQSSALTPSSLEHSAVTPPLLFREVWQQPPHTGPLNDENRRITPEALTNRDLELRLYGANVRRGAVVSPAHHNSAHGHGTVQYFKN